MDPLELQTELKTSLIDIVKSKVPCSARTPIGGVPQYIVPLAESSIDMIMATASGREEERPEIRLAVLR